MDTSLCDTLKLFKVVLDTVVYNRNVFSTVMFCVMLYIY